MHHIRGFIFAYIFNVYLFTNNIVIGLSYVHKKRELNFNNYPVDRSIVNPSVNNNFYQSNDINDPGYTKQNENVNIEKTTLHGKFINVTNPRNFPQFVNPNSQMFHLLYMTPISNRGQQVSTVQQSVSFQTQPLNNNIKNLAYAGPHLFPIQQHNGLQNEPQSNIPINNINAISNNIYPAPMVLRQNQENYFQDSKDATKMEAPFIPSQFLGYGQQQISQPTQQHQIPHQHLLINSQQHQQLPQQNQQQQISQPTQQQQIPHQQQLLNSQQNQQFLQRGQEFPQQYRKHNQQLSHQNQQMPHQVHQPFRPPIKIQLNPEIKPVHEDHQVSSYQSNNFIYMAPNNIYDLYRHSN